MENRAVSLDLLFAFGLGREDWLLTVFAKFRIMNMQVAFSGGGSSPAPLEIN
jgi:hypothetical protein